MEYHTDENIGGKGFRASWRNGEDVYSTGCAGNFTTAAVSLRMKGKIVK